MYVLEMRYLNDVGGGYVSVCGVINVQFTNSEYNGM